MTRRGRRKSRNEPLQELIRRLGRPEVLGSGLVLMAIFTLLSLVTGSRGQLTGLWIDLLSAAVGTGIWGVPVITGVIGLWIVVRAVEKMPNLPWQRPLGLGLLFLAYLIGAALVTGSAGGLRLGEERLGGGWLGYELAGGLAAALSAWGAWSVIILLAITGLVLLTDRLLVEGALWVWTWLQEWRFRLQERQRPLIQPGLPLPKGPVPFWKEWWLRLRERRGRVDPPWIEPPTRPAPAAPAGRTPAQAAASLAARHPTRPVTDAAPLTPRIVGGIQEWRLPRLDEMLEDRERLSESDDHIRHQGRLIQETLALFGVPADFEGAYKGPAVTQYLIKPGYVERNIRGQSHRIKVKVSKIAGLANDLALALAASSVRIEAPIPGTTYVGVEVPNQDANVVGLKELMQSDTFIEMKGRLKIALGEDVKGQPVVTDLTRMPHLLIAGATGSGKSVCINSIIATLLCTHTPDTLRLLMVDPKMVELNVYNGVPHLLSPVVTEVDKAAAVLFWTVKEMERRYQLFSKAGARDLERYNAHLDKRGEVPLPFIVVILDEMADLMMASPEEVEKHVCRLAQMARAVGIHLIIATQRPSVDVITGLIKANFPARIAFAVTSQVDSRVILDVPGADRLLGRGDMLFMAPDASKLERLQGTYLGDDEISRIVRYWKGIRSFDGGRNPSGLEIEVPAGGELLPGTGALELQPRGDEDDPDDLPPARPAFESQPSLFEEAEALRAVDARDELFEEAVRIVLEAGRGSVSLLQRKLRIGYSRASRLVDQLEDAEILGPDLGGSHGRELLISDLEPDPRPENAPQRPRIVGGDEADPPDARPRVWM